MKRRRVEVGDGGAVVLCRRIRCVVGLERRRGEGNSEERVCRGRIMTESRSAVGGVGVRPSECEQEQRCSQVYGMFASVSRGQ